MANDYILAISGSDVLSGGGLQADLATFSAHRLFSFLALTSIATVDAEGFEITAIPQVVFEKQLDSLSAVPFRAIKIGLLPNQEIAESVLAFLKHHMDVPVVLDPVLVFKENSDQEISVMRDYMLKLFPYAQIITPNLREAELLSGVSIATLADMKKAAKVLYDLGARKVVVKGGTRLNKRQAIDLYYDGENYHKLESPIVHRNNNGAGCTFAASIASYLAKAEDALDAVRLSKVFVYHAIEKSNEFGVKQYHEKS